MATARGRTQRASGTAPGFWLRRPRVPKMCQWRARSRATLARRGGKHVLERRLRGQPDRDGALLAVGDHAGAGALDLADVLAAGDVDLDAAALAGGAVVGGQGGGGLDRRRVLLGAGR